jgi:hypothetical protein
VTWPYPNKTPQAGSDTGRSRQSPPDSWQRSDGHWAGCKRALYVQAGQVWVPAVLPHVEYIALLVFSFFRYRAFPSQKQPRTSGTPYFHSLSIFPPSRLKCVESEGLLPPKPRSLTPFAFSHPGLGDMGRSGPSAFPFKFCGPPPHFFFPPTFLVPYPLSLFSSTFASRHHNPTHLFFPLHASKPNNVERRPADRPLRSRSWEL